MGQATEQIERHIAAEREKLDQDLRQIEHQVNAKLARARRNGVVAIGIAMSAAALAVIVRLVSRKSWRRRWRSR